MSWMLVLKILALMAAAALLVETVTASLVDKHREDDIKRKDAGV